MPQTWRGFLRRSIKASYPTLKSEGNLILSRTIKKAAYMQLSDAGKARYEMEAAEYNEKIKHPPPADHIFE